MHQKAHLGCTVRVYTILTVSWRGSVATFKLTLPKMVALQALAAKHKLQQIVSAAVKLHVTHDWYNIRAKYFWEWNTFCTTVIEKHEITIFMTKLLFLRVLHFLVIIKCTQTVIHALDRCTGHFLIRWRMSNKRSRALWAVFIVLSKLPRHVSASKCHL
jgi:hypothetical protein